MKGSHLIRLAAVAALCAAASPQLSAQVTIVSNPSSLTFFLAGGTPGTQQIQLSLSGGVTQTATATLTPSTGILVRNSNTAISVQLPAIVNVNVDPALVPGGTFQGTIRVNVPSSGITGIDIPVFYNRTGSGGGGTIGGNFFANTTGLNFSSITSLTQQFSLSATGGFIPSYFMSVSYVSGFAQNWLQVSPQPGTVSNSSVVTASAVTSGLPAGTYQANITLVPQTGGFNSISVPVTLSVGTQTGTSAFSASPSILQFNYAAGTTAPETRSFTLSTNVGTSYTISASANLAGLVQILPQFGTVLVGTPVGVSVTLVNPSTIPAGTTGFLTVTPSTTAVSAFQIPIQINVSGSTTGTLVISPSTLTFNVPPGTFSTQSQTLTVTSSDTFQQVFSVSTSSTNGFLTALAQNTTTPTTITVGINPAAISQTGTYQGFVTVTPSTGSSAGVPVTIPVTVNVGTSSLITISSNTVALEARAGSTARLSQALQLSLAGGPAVSFNATVTTASGGNWLSASPGTGLIPSPLTIFADPSGLAPGTYTGTVTVSPSGSPAITVNVTLTVTTSGELRVSPASLTFAHQTTSSAPPAAQTVAITSTGTALNWRASATSTGNWLRVTPDSGVTGTNSLSVSVVPTGLAAGTYNGSVSVSSPNASNAALTVNVTLTVTTPIVPTIAAVVNGASFGPTLAAPGLILTITGTDLGPAAALSGAPGASGFPTVLGETSVLFDGRPAPLIYVSSTQISAVVPYELAGRVNTRMQVTFRGQSSRETELRVTDTAPGIFTISQSGSGPGTVQNQNGTLNSAANPERRGNVLIIWTTGLGSVFPPVATGTLAGTLSETSATTRVRIGGREARVIYAGAAPGQIGGLYQINAVIPDDVASGVVPLVVEVGSGQSQPGVTVAVQ